MKRIITALFLLLFVRDLLAQAELGPGVREFVDHDATTLVLQGVRLVDGTGAPAIDDYTVVIRDGRIEAVGPDGSIEAPEGAEVLNLEGHTVIPGLVGLHNHTFYTTSQRSIQISHSAPRLYLASGVTTIRTTGSMSPYAEINLMDAIDRGETPGPRMFVTGPYITGGSGESGMNRVSGAEDARRVVAYWAAEGVTWLKAYTEITRDELGAMIDEAHKHGVKVTAHLCSVTFREAVELGIDNLEHGLFANSDFHPEKRPDECPPDHAARLAEVDVEGAEVGRTIALMLEYGVGMTSTLAVYELIVAGRPELEDRVLEALSDEARAEYLSTRETLAQPEHADLAARRADVFRKAQAFERRFAEAGGLLAAGVDPTGIGGALPGYGDQRNYELLLEAGFGPEEVLQIMTLNGARILGIDEDFGSIEEGKIADLVVIEGDPVARPAEIRNVRWVFKDGLGYNSARLIEAVRGTVGVR